MSSPFGVDGESTRNCSGRLTTSLFCSPQATRCPGVSNLPRSTTSVGLSLEWHGPSDSAYSESGDRHSAISTAGNLSPRSNCSDSSFFNSSTTASDRQTIRAAMAVLDPQKTNDRPFQSGFLSIHRLVSAVVGREKTEEKKEAAEAEETEGKREAQRQLAEWKESQASNTRVRVTLPSRGSASPHRQKLAVEAARIQSVQAGARVPSLPPSGTSLSSFQLDLMQQSRIAAGLQAQWDARYPQ